MAFIFEGTVTQKRRGYFVNKDYGANKLLFWILPSGEVGCTEKCSVLVWFIFLLNTFVKGLKVSLPKVTQLTLRHITLIFSAMLRAIKILTKANL